MANSRNENSGGMCCVQTSMIIFNFITLLGGTSIMGIGIWLLYQSNDPTGPTGMEVLEDVTKEDGLLVNTEFRGFSILLVTLGSLVTFISFLGCFGAFVNSRALLLCYLASVVLILSLQLIISVFAVVYRQPLKSSMRNQLLDLIKTQYHPNSPSAAVWDLMQEQFQCCGVDGPQDYYGIHAWPTERRVPDSCCQLPSQNSTNCGTEEQSDIWNKQGCLGQIQYKTFEQLHILASAIITLVFLQLYGIIASTLLFYHAKALKVQKTSKTTPYSPYKYKSYSYERAGLM